MAFFRTRRFWLGIIVIAGVLIFSGIVTLRVLAPPSSDVGLRHCIADDSGDCLRFPQIRGLNLNGEPRILPDDFGGKLNFMVIAFTEDQLLEAQEWLPQAQALAEQRPDFAYYSLSVLPDIDPTVRLFVLAGLTLLIPDETLRDVSLLAYLEDIDAFLSALNIADRETIVALLLDENGEILWRADGAYSDEAAAGLVDVVNAGG
ncbi:MAG: hypothetical protein D6712_09520 [Chloroflexi bacterium]|nr:MAG: hypothetical protein D6712_09520 [Chloroflexota bacterium]